MPHKDNTSFQYLNFYNILSDILINIIVYDNIIYAQNNNDYITHLYNTLLWHNPNKPYSELDINDFLDNPIQYIYNLEWDQILPLFKKYILYIIELKCQNDSYYFTIMRGFCKLNHLKQIHLNDNLSKLIDNNNNKINILEIINIIKETKTETYIRKFNRTYKLTNVLDNIMAHFINMPYNKDIINVVYNNIIDQAKTYIIDYQNICMIIHDHLKLLEQKNYNNYKYNPIDLENYICEFLYNIVKNDNTSKNNYVIIIYKPSSKCKLNLNATYINPIFRNYIITNLNIHYFIIDYNFNNSVIKSSSFDDYIFWVIAIAFYFIYNRIQCDTNNYNYLSNLILYTNDRQYLHIKNYIFSDIHYKSKSIKFSHTCILNKYNDDINDNNEIQNNNINLLKICMQNDVTQIAKMKNLIPEPIDFNNLRYICYTNSNNTIIIDNNNQSFHKLLLEFNYILYPYSTNFFETETHPSSLNAYEIMNYMFCHKNKYIFDVTNTQKTEYYTPFELIKTYHDPNCNNIQVNNIQFNNFFISNNSKFSGNNILFLTLIKYIQYLKYRDINGSEDRVNIIKQILPPSFHAFL